jgi:hypothetical protein
MTENELVMLSRTMPPDASLRAIAAGDRAVENWRGTAEGRMPCTLRAAKLVALELAMIAEGALAVLGVRRQDKRRG